MNAGTISKPVFESFLYSKFLTISTLVRICTPVESRIATQRNIWYHLFLAPRNDCGKFGSTDETQDIILERMGRTTGSASLSSPCLSGNGMKNVNNIEKDGPSTDKKANCQERPHL
mmetsp:Transcript_54450/g.99538  ORF Transcript_54450/g.99538 Transcript_54450/m.99538 type:complete len:116 (-) Transcript_54450:105-452(-)